jgi:hypothetical protein
MDLHNQKKLHGVVYVKNYLHYPNVNVIDKNTQQGM